MASSAGGVFGVRRPGRFEVPDLPWGDVGHRQGLRDRLDEAVGEDEHDFLQSLAEQGAAMEGSRVPGGFGVVSPSRVSPGSFTQDPGMRARDEFTDITSRGYNEQAKRVAERGGAKEYATSVGQEEAEAGADELRNAVALILASLVGGAGLGRGTAARTPWGMTQKEAAANRGFWDRGGTMADLEKAFSTGQWRQAPLRWHPDVPLIRPNPGYPARGNFGPGGVIPPSAMRPYVGRTVVDPTPTLGAAEYLRRRG